MAVFTDVKLQSVSSVRNLNGEIVRSIQSGSSGCGCREDRHQTRRIAITGGPGAGKTAILEMAAKAFCIHVTVVPESASIVFGGGFPRRTSDRERRAAQRAIFYVQRELETLVLEDASFAIALCDRGTVDGLAYWPGGAESLWESVGTSHEAELKRYDAVIHLETPSAADGYNHLNRVRSESAAEAQALDAQILDAWSAHPNRQIVASSHDFLTKAQIALGLVRAELPSCCAKPGL